MEFIKVKTRAFLPPRDNIYQLMEDYLPQLKDGDLLAVTSKILSIHQGRCVKANGTNKNKLAINEAEKYIPRKINTKSKTLLTIKNNSLVYSAGVDESNGNGHFILHPENLEASAKEIYSFLKKKFRLKNLGILITDSISTPMRYGAVGVGLGFYGFQPIRDYRGKKDIFGRKFQYERANVVDPLAALSVLIMGEGNEKTPMLIVRGANFIKFTKKEMHRQLFIPASEDKFYPLLKIFRNK